MATRLRTVVFLGDVQDARPSLNHVASSFGWGLLGAQSLPELRALSRERDVVAVFFDPRGLSSSWPYALKSVLQAAPGAAAIVCYSFADAIPWPEMAQAGAFHCLNLPLDPDEVRQSLGFVREAQLRRASSVA